MRVKFDTTTLPLDKVVANPGLKNALSLAFEGNLEDQELKSRFKCSGILLHGPPGCGKTSMMQAFAMEYAMTFYNLSANKLPFMYVGQAEK